MKFLILLALVALACSSCTALPAEERAFAVALCIEKADEWRVCARIPTYQSGGGYMTVTGNGETFPAALSHLDAASPMRINLSQLRLLVADVGLVNSGGFAAVLSTLSERPDIRMQCIIALTESNTEAVAEALVPAMGTRLSKALDLMIDERIEQGAILPAVLADVLRMGQRQSPILAALTLEGKEISLSGGYTLDGISLTADETALLSLLLGQAREMHLSLPGGSADVRDILTKVRLDEHCTSAHVELTLTATASTLSEDELAHAMISELMPLLTRMSAVGCDVLGLGRQAVMGTHDVPQWHALNWPDRYRSIRWEVAVGVNGLT